MSREVEIRTNLTANANLKYIDKCVMINFKLYLRRVNYKGGCFDLNILLRENKSGETSMCKEER